MKLVINNNDLYIKEAISFKDRLIGLIGKTNIDYGMIFYNCNAIHTFMMKENIDIIGIDQNNTIIYIYENLPKNRIIKINNHASKTSIIELPVLTSKYFKLNDKITLKK